jgi:hypothetical protein
MAAGIGTFSGVKIVRYNHAHPHTLLDRLLLGARAAPTGDGGWALAWSLPAP